MLRRALVVAVLGLLIGEMAPADTRADALPRLRAEVAVARAFWAARGVTGCPDGITVTIAPTAQLDGAVAHGGFCRVIVQDYFVWMTRTRDDREGECAVVTHEVGHALGLSHTATGIMAPAVEVVPYGCVLWARPARTSRHSRRRSRRGAEERLPEGFAPLKGVVRSARSARTVRRAP